MAWNDWKAPSDGMSQQVGTQPTATTDILGRTYNFQTGQWESQKPAASGWDVAKQTSLVQSGADYSPYQNRLMGLLNDPSTIEQTPGYKFQVEQGNQAINRSAAAKGMLGSGNVLAELAKYGQGMASQEYGGQVNRLADLMRGAQQFGVSTGQLKTTSYGSPVQANRTQWANY